MAAVPLTDETGFGLAAMFFVWHEVRYRKRRRGRWRFA